jgi:hypothetical protein
MLSPEWQCFAQMWAHDFEFTQGPGETPAPLCWVAHELRSGRTIRLWRDELLGLRDAPIPVGPDCLHVVFYGPAEWSCFLALGWTVPTRVVDLYVEHRLTTNLALGKSRRRALLPQGDSLVGAAKYRGIAGVMTAAEKEAERDLIVSGGPWTAEEQARIVRYCEADVLTTARLFRAMAPTIDLPRALVRGRYTPAVARMERTGVPLDVETFGLLRDRWDAIKLRVVAEDDRLGLFDGASFSEERFDAYLAGRGQWWPRFPSGRPVLDDDTFKAMVALVPELAPVRRIRQTLAETRLFRDLAVGPDGRNRTMLSMFATATGRNAPSNSKFIFGPSAWARGLIQPPPGWALAYVDYASQEFAVAAYMANDRAMIDAYESGLDVYLAFGARAGIVPADVLTMPPDEAKARYKAERKQLKAAVLGSQYGLQAEGLARQIGRSRSEAAELLASLRRASPDYWRWAEGAVALAMATGRLTTCLGWATIVHPETRATSLLNWPLQAHAAEMLRLACCQLTEAGIRVSAPVHDAVLIEAPADAIDDATVRTRTILADASAVVLGGPRLRSDAEVVHYPGRLLDDASRPSWDRLMRHLDAEEAGAGPGGRLAVAGALPRPQAIPGMSCVPRASQGPGG